MIPYGAKKKNWDYLWTGKEEILIYSDAKFSKKRTRRLNKEAINHQIDEMAENQNLDELERIAELYGDVEYMAEMYEDDE